MIKRENLSEAQQLQYSINLFKEDKPTLVHIINVLVKETRNSWYDATKHLPEIPKGMYAIEVIVATWDGDFQDVYECSYGKTKNRYGDVINNSFTEEEQFMEMYIDGNGKFTWMPIMDKVTHWKYMPIAPELESGYYE